MHYTTLLTTPIGGFKRTYLYKMEFPYTEKSRCLTTQQSGKRAKRNDIVGIHPKLTYQILICVSIFG